MVTEELIREFKGIFERLDLIFQKATYENNRLLLALVEHQKWRDMKYEEVMAKELVIPQGESKEFSPVNNPGYNRARVFLDAGFTPAHSAGLSVILIYKNSPMGEILKIISSNGSAGKVSEPIDIAQLSGFYFQITNQDSSQDTTVKNFRIVLYNEARA